VIEIFLLVAFFMGLVLGAVIADWRGRLPSVETLQAEDRVRFARFERSL
jgi:hypothetical protein